MVHLKSLAFFLIVVIAFLSIWIGISIRECNMVENQRNNYLIQLDSLRAENSKVVSQLQYLEKYYDSSKKKIPEPNGFAFIGDSIPLSTK